MVSLYEVILYGLTVRFLGVFWKSSPVCHVSLHMV